MKFLIASALIVGSVTIVSAQQTPKAEVVTEQYAAHVLMTNFLGIDVFGKDGKKLGDVTDIVIDRQGHIAAYIVDIGGFLGLGAKRVAFTPGSFVYLPVDNDPSGRLSLNLTREEARLAPQVRLKKH